MGDDLYMEYEFNPVGMEKPMKTQDELNKSGEIHGSEFDRRKRPTIAELEAILEKGGGKIDIAPNGEVNQRAYTLTEKLAQLLNYHSMEQFSDTPDFILAEYMMDCFRAWNKGVEAREKWYGRPINTKDSSNG